MKSTITAVLAAGCALASAGVIPSAPRTTTTMTIHSVYERAHEPHGPYLYDLLSSASGPAGEATVSLPAETVSPSLPLSPPAADSSLGYHAPSPDFRTPDHNGARAVRSSAVKNSDVAALPVAPRFPSRVCASDEAHLWPFCNHDLSPLAASGGGSGMGDKTSSLALTTRDGAIPADALAHDIDRARLSPVTESEDVIVTVTATRAALPTMHSNAVDVLPRDVPEQYGSMGPSNDMSKREDSDGEPKCRSHYKPLPPRLIDDYMAKRKSGEMPRPYYTPCFHDLFPNLDTDPTAAWGYTGPPFKSKREVSEGKCANHYETLAPWMINNYVRKRKTGELSNPYYAPCFHELFPNLDSDPTADWGYTGPPPHKAKREDSDDDEERPCPVHYDHLRPDQIDKYIAMRKSGYLPNPWYGPCFHDLFPNLPSDPTKSLGYTGGPHFKAAKREHSGEDLDGGDPDLFRGVPTRLQ